MRRDTGPQSVPRLRPSFEYEMGLIVERLRSCKERTPLILEVGCGSKSLIASSLRESKFTFSIHGLDVNDYVRENKDMDMVYVGSVEDIPLGENIYDIVISQFLMEHLTDYQAALREMSRVLRQGGMLVLLFPNPLSPEALVTRLTPFWFHVWFRKHISRIVDADKHTFPTTFSFKSVHNIIQHLRKNGCDDIIVQFFGETHYRFRKRPVMLRLVLSYLKFLDRWGLQKFNSTAVLIASKVR